MYQRTSWFSRSFTPWARGAIAFNEINPLALRERIPAGWEIGGSGSTSRGPFRFSIRHVETGQVHWAYAHGFGDVPAALDRLLGLASLTDDLEAQLRASLEAIQ